MINTTKVLQRAQKIAADTDCTLLEVLLAAVVGALHTNDVRTIASVLEANSFDQSNRY